MILNYLRLERLLFADSVEIGDQGIQFVKRSLLWSGFSYSCMVTMPNENEFYYADRVGVVFLSFYDDLEMTYFCS